MILTVFTLLLPLVLLLPALRHWLYAIHITIVAAISWWRFPSLDLPIWHPYYVYFLTIVHFATISLVTFAAYGWDKYKARTNGWRVPEKTLHALALIGGIVGAYAGSKFFRHKTTKTSFRSKFWLVAIAQIILIILATLLT